VGIDANENPLLSAIFELVERVTGAELINPGRKLLIAYYQEARGPTPADRAREAIRRYAQWEPPSLDEIRERHRAGTMEDIDWLVLKVENEARKLTAAGRSPSPPNRNSASIEIS
jgi:hypothetical protein